MAIVVLLCGFVTLLYSPWSQRTLVDAVRGRFGNNPGGTELHLRDFSLRFPLKLSVEGLSLTQQGDTLMGAERLSTSVNLLPLLIGEVGLDHTELIGGRYTINNPDSLMYLTLRADSVGLAPATVRLAGMKIKLSEATIARADMGIYLKPDTSAPTPPAPPTDMAIELDRLNLQQFRYTMRLMPSIDTLTALIPSAVLAGGNIDLLNQKIQLGGLTGSGLDARYITPDSAAIAAAGPYPPVATTDTASAAPWTVTIDSINFGGSHALYALAGYSPLPGLDFSYIEVSDLDLAISHFYNQATTLRLPLRVSGVERCGVDLAVDGELLIDSVALKFNDFNLSTSARTRAWFQGLMGMGDMTTDPDLPLSLQLRSAFSPSDLGKMFVMAGPIMAAMPEENPIELNVDLEGTTGLLDLHSVELKINRCLSLEASGQVENMMNPADIGGDLTLDGRIINVNRLKNHFLDRATARSLNIPPMTLGGHVTMNSGVASGNLRATAQNGDIRLNARWNSRFEDYDLKLTTDRFPVQAFMPLLGVGPVTLSLTANGHGYNPFAATTHIDAKLDIAKTEYNNVELSDMVATAALQSGQGSVHLDSRNPDLDFSVDANGNLDGDSYTWHASLDARNVDLYTLGFATEASNLELMADADATLGPGKNDLDAKLHINDMYYRQLSGTVFLNDVDAALSANDSLTSLRLDNRDLHATLTVFSSPDSIMARMPLLTQELDRQIGAFNIDADTLQRLLPSMQLNLTAGASNMLNDFLNPSGMSFRSLAVTGANDSSLHLNAVARRLATSTMTLDSVYTRLGTEGKGLRLDAGLLNRPGNLDQWHQVDLKAFVSDSTMTFDAIQRNVQNKVGFRFGAEATAQLSDSTFTLRIDPFDPIISYQQWTVNSDNFVSYTVPTHHVDANLHMSGGNSSLAIYTEHTGDVHEHHHGEQQEDLVLKLTDIHIQDWISFNPFAPPMKGDVSADLRLNTIDNMIVGHGNAGITNFIYGRERVADFRTDFDVAADKAGSIHANADVFVNDIKTITLRGTLNDSTALNPMALDFSMIRFPLETVNPFMPAGTARMRGVLNGTLDITGTPTQPVMNGYLNFDSTAVRVTMLGTDLNFSDIRIPVDSSLVSFNNFAITACNENPLTINGTVDIADMTAMKIDLALKTRNMQLVNSSRASRGSDVYGKAYIDLDASVRGNTAFMSVDADLKLLSGTNVTYVMPMTSSQIMNYSTGDMVKFVNFTDSLAVVHADSITQQTMAMLLLATLDIEEGTIVNVDLSTDGKNKAQVQANGHFDYTMTPMNSGRLTGRLNIEKGFVRYSLPLGISDFNFNLQPDGWVAFTGDMLNPSFNIKAIDVIKANVTQSGQNSRLVNFDVILNASGTLNQINAAFDLTTDDDISVANELETMSADQRATQAMNLLLYHTYTGPGTKADASMSNPLYSFLAGQLNSWAANTIKGVDVSFGVNQYDRTLNGSTSQTTSYSYQVSKSLFNDRFKIVVGGNYSTDADADENFSQNLINDISFEYFLNNARNMYLRIFRHTGYESILEGEITQTGVGFVYRRKLERVGDMFLPAAVVRRREELLEQQRQSIIKHDSDQQ